MKTLSELKLSRLIEKINTKSETYLLSDEFENAIKDGYLANSFINRKLLKNYKELSGLATSEGINVHQLTQNIALKMYPNLNNL